MRGTRVTRVAPLLTGLALAGVVLTGCTPSDGHINETETGRNGVKLEVKDGDGDYEVYLVPDTTCREGMYLDDCADADDYLVPPPGSTPGLNSRR